MSTPLADPTYHQLVDALVNARADPFTTGDLATAVILALGAAGIWPASSYDESARTPLTTRRTRRHIR